MGKLINHLKHLSSAAALLLGAAHAEPPRWLVSDENSTMVLFPTVHFLPGETEWVTDNLLTSLMNAQEVWFELPQGPEAQQVAHAALGRAGVDPARPLGGALDPKLYQRTVDAAEGFGLTAEQIEPLRPWLVALTLFAMDLNQGGVTASVGAEQVLSSAAEGKKMRALETADAQAELFGSMSDETQAAFLEETLNSLGGSASELRRIAEAWRNGDTSVIESEVLGAMRESYPDVYEAMFVARNRNWTVILSEELEGAGTDFVAVGAGHLVGDDGVPAMLRSRGYRVERLGSKGGAE